MPAATYGVTGRGPAVVLLHGVGPGPESFAEIAEDLAVDHLVLTVERPWSPRRPTSLDEQALSVVAALRHAGVAPATIVGVSGGATLALHLATYAPEVVAGLVVHEPLVGRHAPSLARVFAEGLRRVQADDGEVISFVRDVMGPTAWERLPPLSRMRVEGGAARARNEVPVFASFAPTAEELGALRSIPLVTSVGGDSGPARFEAARALERLAGARIEVIEAAGNLVHVEQPAAFVSLVRRSVAGRVAA